MTSISRGGGPQSISPRQLQDGSRSTSQASQTVQQTRKQADTISKMPRPQDQRSAAAFEKNLKQAAKLAHQVNARSTQLNKKTAASVKGLPKEDQKKVAKEIGKHVQVMDKGGTDLDRAIAKLLKAKPPAAKGKPKPADDKKAVQMSQDLVKKLQVVLKEMNGVEQNVVAKLPTK